MPEKMKNILIAEDERPLARALELKLQNAGFKTRVAVNGVEALDFLKKEKFDLILLDLVMPTLSGFDVLLKLDQLKNKTPVIVSSNLGQKEDLDRVKELGVSHYFIKSETGLVEIVKHVQDFFGKSKASLKTKK